MSRVYKDVDLRGKNFSDQDSNGATFENCNLTGTSFRHADLCMATFHRCRAFPEESDAEGAIADFAYADLKEARFEN